MNPNQYQNYQNSNTHNFYQYQPQPMYNYHPNYYQQQYQAPNQFAQQREQNLNNYKTKICKHFTSGKCSLAERCNFAHGLQELRNQVRESEQFNNLNFTQNQIYEELEQYYQKQLKILKSINQNSSNEFTQKFIQNLNEHKNNVDQFINKINQAENQNKTFLLQKQLKYIFKELKMTHRLSQFQDVFNQIEQSLKQNDLKMTAQFIEQILYNQNLTDQEKQFQNKIIQQAREINKLSYNKDQIIKIINQIIIFKKINYKNFICTF